MRFLAVLLAAIVLGGAGLAVSPLDRVDAAPIQNHWADPPCGCFGLTGAGTISPKLTIVRTKWFGINVTPKDIPVTSGQSWKIPDEWYSGINDLGWGRTVTAYFSVTQSCDCEMVSVQTGNASGIVCQPGANYNPREKNYHAGGTGWASGQDIPDGTCWAVFYCSCCAGGFRKCDSSSFSVTKEDSDGDPHL